MRRSVKEIAHFFGKRSDRKDVVEYVAFDSRKVSQGSLFFALLGEKMDGHSFLEEVAQKGGVAAVVLSSYSGPHFGLELIPVQDVTQALQALAHDVYLKNPPFIVSVTGSAGKTTTKEFIATLLAEKFPVAKNEGSMNSQVGLPLTLLNWRGKEKVMILEMGMSHPGELSRLIQIAPPNLGVLTNVSYQHAAFFRDLEGIAAAKCEMFASPKMKEGIFNIETEAFEAVQSLKLAKTRFHLSDAKADYTLENIPIPPPFTESHFQQNFLAAVAVARKLDLSWGEIARAATKLKACDHRFQKVEKKGVLFIDDSYNASPLSMKAALMNLPKGKRRIGVLGAMGELGAVEEKSHHEVGEYAARVLDHLICIGAKCAPMVKVFQREGKPVFLFEEKKGAVFHLKELLQEGDVVLVKGSNLLKLWTVLEEV